MSDRQDDGIVRHGDWIGIGNEFTGVRLRKVFTPQGERLEIEVPKRGYRILLDAMQLEIVAAQDPERFSELFAVQFGSDEEDGN
ncbi:hypothetical protein SRB17_18020 [Streptomyces sp. RB17]|uniref:hypothetical protein n=1 Tax=Streptomyces sp. RB17 TaxID=2585197 RepID=UPI001295D4F0|nr:hypothetical protein [Streptomyces sp. RB17]MQY33837.1 hypothetical protein [Streptomyces sp. RB17]